MPEGITEQDRLWHRLYDRLPKKAKEAVKAAFIGTNAVFFDHGFAACVDDRAESLVAAITRFLVECNDGVELAAEPDGAEIEYDEAGNTYSG